MSEAPQYAYVEIANALETEIASGRIPVGGRLENERELGDRFRVSPGTVRRAVRELRDRGLVVTLPSKGSYVIATPGTGTGQHG